MAFRRVVISSSGFNLLYVGVAPHLHSILRRLATGEHFGGKFVLFERKNHRYFPFSSSSRVIKKYFLGTTTLRTFVLSGHFEKFID